MVHRQRTARSIADLIEVTHTFTFHKFGEVTLAGAVWPAFVVILGAMCYLMGLVLLIRK